MGPTCKVKITEYKRVDLPAPVERRQNTSEDITIKMYLFECGHIVEEPDNKYRCTLCHHSGTGRECKRIYLHTLKLSKDAGSNFQEDKRGHPIVKYRVPVSRGD